jgi:hypothetical protein
MTFEFDSMVCVESDSLLGEAELPVLGEILSDVKLRFGLRILHHTNLEFLTRPSQRG